MLYTERTLTLLVEKLKRLNDEESWNKRPELSILIIRNREDDFLAFVNHRKDPLSTGPEAYRLGQRISMEYSGEFYALLQATMREADTLNLEKLKSLFPEVLDDLVARREAPGGNLPTDR